MSFTDNLKKYRARAGYTQKSAAKALNMSQSGYSKWELGTSSPDPETLKKIVNLFGCSIDDLLDTAESGDVNIDSSTMINSVRDSKNTTVTVTGNYELSPQERGLIDMFRSLSFEDQVSIMQAVVEAAKKHN